MTYGIWDFLMLLGALCIFIFGMKVMSEGLQKMAGQRMKGILKGMTSNRFMGVMTGFILTVMLQTSSGTTVLVVSFVNAGLLSLFQAMGVIMGANIGTTLTAWMISLFGFKVDILNVAIPLMGVMLPFYFVKNKTLRGLAEFIIGFGILFIGIDYLKTAVPDIQSNPEILSFLQKYTQQGFWSILIFVIFGTILTVSVQSSSAATAITLALIAQGYIDFQHAAAIFLGENIGTTITANLAALVGNVHAKRAAKFHLIFNLVGVIWVLSIFTPFLNFIDTIIHSLNATFDDINLLSPFSDDVDTRGQSMIIAISIFHSLFNLTNVLLFIGFIPLFERLVIWLQPSKGDQDEMFRLQYIDAGTAHNTELSLYEAKKGIQLFAKLIDKMNFSFMALLFEKHKNSQKILDKIKKREEITDSMEIEIGDFLTRVSEQNLSAEDSRRIRGMLNIINDLESIGDIYNEMAKNFERMKELNVVLPEDALDELHQMLDLVYESIKLTRANLEAENGKIKIQDAYNLEQKIDDKRDELKKAHFQRLEQLVYPVQAGVIYLDYVNRLEKVGDLLLNVNEALADVK
jgi:phosphate:Na+ symporter